MASYACMPMGKYLNKLDELMSWSLISLNLQYYYYSLLTHLQSQPSYTHFTMGNKLWKLLFSDKLSALPKESPKYCIALSLSILIVHFRMIV